MTDNRQPNPSAVDAKWRLANAAARDCRHCGRCGDPIADGQAVWRDKLMLSRGPFKGSYAMAPQCARCNKSTWRMFGQACPCEHCGRPVHHLLRPSRRRRSFCCENCEIAVRAGVAKRHRSEARGTRPCATCGEMFEPARADGRFCGGGCKQVAYRRRKAVVTDVVCLFKTTIESRNAAEQDANPERQRRALRRRAQQQEPHHDRQPTTQPVYD
jgi:hypothetical protein